MSDTNQSAEATAPEYDATQDSAEDIAEAKSLGWRSPTDWRGKPPPHGFQSAREWIDRSHQIQPLVEKQLAKERKEKDRVIAELQAFKHSQEEKFANLERMSKAALDEQRKQIEREYAAKKEAAVELGDTQKYRQLAKEEKEDLAELKKSAEKPESKTQTQQTLPREIERAIDDWRVDNDWYGNNRAMTAAAIQEEQRLQQEFPNLSFEKRLEKVTEYIHEEFPHKFKREDEDEDEDEAPRRRGSSVESGSRLNGSGGNRSLYSKLPPEAKVQADRFIKEDGLFLEKGEKAENPQHLHAARERYARSYEEHNR